MRFAITSLAAAAIAAYGLVPIVAEAQQAPGYTAPGTAAPGTPPGTPPGISKPNNTPPANISEQKLDQEAAAIRQVANVKMDYQQRLSKAPDSDKKRLANEGNSALEKAVTDQGLSVEEYTSILQVAQNDAQVHQKLMERLYPAGQAR